MVNRIKDNILKFYNKNKNILADFCFGALLLWNLVAVPIILREVISIMNSNRGYLIPFSTVWYEQSKEVKIFFEQQHIDLLMACLIMASLLYYRYKKLAFLCLIIPSVYVVAQRLMG